MKPASFPGSSNSFSFCKRVNQKEKNISGVRCKKQKKMLLLKLGSINIGSGSLKKLCGIIKKYTQPIPLLKAMRSGLTK